MSAFWTAVMVRMAKWLADWEYKRAKAREAKRKMPIKLSIVILACALSQGCASFDRAYIWTYEMINGTNTMEDVSCGTK